MRPIGWRGEPHRHYLASKGVKTNAYMAKSRSGFSSEFSDLDRPRSALGRFAQQASEGARAQRRADVRYAGVETSAQLRLQKEGLKTRLTEQEEEKRLALEKELREPRKKGGSEHRQFPQVPYDIIIRKEAEIKQQKQELSATAQALKTREDAAHGVKDMKKRAELLAQVEADRREIAREQGILKRELLRTQRDIKKIRRAV